MSKLIYSYKLLSVICCCQPGRTHSYFPTLVDSRVMFMGKFTNLGTRREVMGLVTVTAPRNR